MKQIQSIDELERLYGDAMEISVTKVTPKLTPHYRAWIEASRFLVLSTVGPEGTDASPRGDDGPVIRIVDDTTFWLPDWRGNNRIDSLRNIVRDGRVSLMFMVPGSNNVVRVNGTAVLTDDPEITGSFVQKRRHPRTVIVIKSQEIYFQCAKALMRAGLWGRDDAKGIPSAGDFVKAVHRDFDAESYDSGYTEYAKGRMW